MNNNCEKMEDKIADLITGILSDSEKLILEQHLSQCPRCQNYRQALQKEDQLLIELFDKLDANMTNRQEKVISTVNNAGGVKGGNIISIIRKLTTRRITRFAAAALLLIVAGYTVGRSTASQPADVEQLRYDLETSLKSSLEPAIHKKVVEDLNQQWQLALVHSYVQLRGELNQQFRNEMNEFAVQTLAASSTVTNQLLTELIDAISTAQRQDRRWTLAAMEQIELNRLRDNALLKNDFATFAVYTEDNLQRTREDMTKWITTGYFDNPVLDE